jgi:DNA-directed RNA polymerase subunit omega
MRILPTTMLPSPDKLNNYEGGKFVLANLAAKRAKQLREGAMPLVQIDSPHPLTIALAEIAAGKIKPIYDKAIDTSTTDAALVNEESISGEFGMLLPALDETEVSLVLGVDDEGVDVLDDAEISLADLDLGDEGDAEVEAVVPDEDEPLSLNEMQEQEASDSEDSEE